MITSRKAGGILIVTPAAPYPQRASGISVRYLPIIRHLSARHTVDLLIVSNGSVTAESAAALKEYCREVTVIDRRTLTKPSVFQKIPAKLRTLLPAAIPHTYLVYGTEGLGARIAACASRSQYDAAVWVTGQYTQYLDRLSAKRLVVDFIDSPALSLQRRVFGCSRLAPHAYECWKMRRWEAQIIRRAAATIYVSDVDAHVVPESLAPGRRRYVIPNGVSLEGYTSSVEASVSSPSIGFLGNMAYPPNVEAVQWLYEEVFVSLRSTFGNLTLYVIGRDPVDSILALGTCPGVVVTGAVDEIWPYVNAVDVFALPIWTGAGLKNKVLEAMYAKRPVVTTPIGSEGIGATSGRELIVCSEGERFKTEVGRLLTSPHERRNLGDAGHALVTERFSWGRILEAFESVILGRDAGSSSLVPDQ